MATRKPEPRHDGTFWGIKDGRIVAVQKWLERSGVYLTSMDDDGVEVRHHLMPGQAASAEVIVVFGLRDVAFVDAADSDTEKERTVRGKLEAAIAGRS